MIKMLRGMISLLSGMIIMLSGIIIVALTGFLLLELCSTCFKEGLGRSKPATNP
jgi:hypothetical protein